MHRATNWLYALVLVVGIPVALFFSYGHKLVNPISDEIALTHFKRLAQTENVVIVSRTNDHWLFGNSHDVSYELTIEDQPESGRCTSGATSPIICRLYGQGGGE